MHSGIAQTADACGGGDVRAVLSACGGGGGGSNTTGPSLTAGGVAAVVEYDTAASLSVKKGSTVWTESPATADVQAAPTGWASETRLNAAAATATERFRVVAIIASDSDKDYLAYGYWNRIPLDDLGDYKPFYYGAMPYYLDTGKWRALIGEATYRGGATGVYQTDTSSSATAVARRFTADVTVGVSFAAATQIPDMWAGLSNIKTRTSDGTEAGPTILDTATGALGASNVGTSFFQVSDSGYRWGGHFYGPSSGVPTGVAGWFKQLRGNINKGGNVVLAVTLDGTFAAKRQ